MSSRTKRGIYSAFSRSLAPLRVTSRGGDLPLWGRLGGRLRGRCRGRGGPHAADMGPDLGPVVLMRFGGRGAAVVHPPVAGVEPAIALVAVEPPAIPGDLRRVGPGGSIVPELTTVPPHLA